MVRSARPRRLTATFVPLVLAAAGPACKDEVPPSAEREREQDIVRSPYFDRVQDDIAQLLRLVRMQPDNAQLRVDLGRRFIEGWMPAIGERHLVRALRIDPAHVEARELLARSLADRQELDEAVRVLEEGLRLREAAPLLALLGSIELARRPSDPGPARAALDRALELDAGCVGAAYERARLAECDGDEALAVRLYERVIALRPNHLGATFNLARLVRRDNDHARADELLERHRRLSALDDLGHLDAPHSVEASLALAEMRIDGGAVDEGIAELTDGVGRHSDVPILRVRLALALARAGRRDAALDEFDRALRDIPRDPMILNQFAWFLATTGETPEARRRALGLAEKAVHETRGADPNALDTLAEARAVNGDAAGALTAIDEALRLRPDDPDLRRRQRRFGRAAGERE